MKQNSILVRYKIIKARFVSKQKVGNIAISFELHRNTVTNICNLFTEKAPDQIWKLLHKKLSFDEIMNNFKFLEPQSRKPKSHKLQASKKSCDFICAMHSSYGRGYPRMYTYLLRANLLHEYNLTLGKIKGIYRKFNLKTNKVKSKSGKQVSLYNYNNLAPFEKLHYDTKHILDKSALPADIYNKFNLDSNLPIYQWTIIDAYSRFRFLAYSNSLNSTFGFEFLLFVIMFIRSLYIYYPIVVGTDGGVEFFSGSKKKENEWNEILSVLDTNIYCYNGPRDIRKNLIERSQKSDDEEFYIPRGQFINNKKDFVVEATNWFYYWNFQRKHMGKSMNGLTPFEKLQQSGLWNIKPLFNFPTLILNDCISNLIYHNKSIKTASLLNKNPNLSSQKNIIDFKYKHFLQNNIFAQNVLDVYLLISLLNKIKILILKRKRR